MYIRRFSIVGFIIHRVYLIRAEHSTEEEKNMSCITESYCYADAQEEQTVNKLLIQLKSLLPPATYNDDLDIMQRTIFYIQELHDILSSSDEDEQSDDEMVKNL